LTALRQKKGTVKQDIRQRNKYWRILYSFSVHNPRLHIINIFSPRQTRESVYWQFL